MELGKLTPDHVYICCGHTDMRKSIDGLAAIVEYNFTLSPFENDLFLFSGRRHDRIKGLLWRGDGFLLLYKRLDNGRFAWPKSADALRNITEQQYRWLMEGLDIDQPKAVKKTYPKHII